MDKSGSHTSLSLLLQIKQAENNEDAWRTFVDRYGARIYQWCVNRNLQPSDAEDVTQNVLAKLARQLKSFEYDNNQSFRGWLRRITENALNDFFREQKRQYSSGAAGGLSQLDIAEIREELIGRLESAFDLELLDKAVDMVRQRVNQNRFQAWELSAMKGMSAAEIAAQLDMKIATVYTAKNQIQSLLQQEVQKLERSANLS